MKKLFLIFALTAVMAVSANASELKRIGNTPYYHYIDDKGMLEFCDEDGKFIKEAPYFWAEEEGTGIVFKDKEKLKCGIMDMELNIVVEPIYSEIEYNDNTGAFNCRIDDDDTYEMDYYDSNFNKIPQPLDISPIDSTQYYALKVIGDGHPHTYYICDKDGNKLIDEGYYSLEGAGGSIIAEKTDSHDKGIYDDKLNVAVPFEYATVSFRNDRFYCDKFVDHKKETLCLYKDFTPAVEVEDIYSTPYFTKKDEDGLYYICDEKGNVLKEQGYAEVYSAGGGIVVRSDSTFPYYYGLLDSKLNNVIDEKYYYISTNGSGDYLCYLDGKIDIYNKSTAKLTGTEDSDMVFVKPLRGSDGKYIYDQTAYSNEYLAKIVRIIDGEGKSYTESGYMGIDDTVQPGNTVIVHGIMGHSDPTTGVLGSNYKLICGMSYGDKYVKEENGVVYIEAVWEGSETEYYDLNGKQYKTKAEVISAGNISEPSSWAVQSIKDAVELGFVPEELQSDYRKNITRQEFCRLAMELYSLKTGYKVDMTAQSPFVDVSDPYITAAYGFKITSGTGDRLFSPDKNITRQESAVMLRNVASLLGIESGGNTAQFVDESYFASWAKDAIYSVASMKSGDTFVMAGTGEGKFSPWMNYTREQAIATMLRLYNCDSADK